MTPHILRRAYLPALLGVIVLAVVLQFDAPPHRTAQSSSPTLAETTPPSTEAEPPSPASVLDFRDWLDSYRVAPATRRDGMLEQGRLLAVERRDAFLALMRDDPAAALDQALTLTEAATLPDELSPYFERPFTGVGSIDLLWRTDLEADGSLRCRHEHALHLGDDSWTLFGPGLQGPSSPRKDVPVSGIALGNLAVLAPSAVRPLEPSEVAAARKLFPAGNKDGVDPVTGGPALVAHSALVGGKVYQFESAGVVQYVTDALFAAEQDAEDENRYQIEHGFEWLAASGAGGDEGESPVDATPFMDDTIDVLFIRVDFSDFPGEPVSQVDLETTLNAVKGHIEEYSYNAATIVPTVTPTVYRMPSTGASYATAGDNNGIQDDARALASADYTIANYDVIAVFFPDLDGVPGSQIEYGGLASIGGDNHWINGTNSTNVILHEFGHNYGLYHSNYWDPTESIAGDYDVPSSLEYGDIFDRMGDGLAPEGHFNHFAKNRLQWMPDSKVAEPTADGTFRIYRFDHLNALANATLAVKVPMGGDVYYWVGYRQLYTSPSYNLSTGAYLVAEGLSENAETNLIDATPGSQPSEEDDRADCGLEMGTPFVDSGVTFTAVARGGTSPNEWIDVSIAFAGRVGFVSTTVDVDEQAGVARLTLQRQFSTAGTATVNYTTSNGSATDPDDYYATSGKVTWTNGDSDDKTVSIPIRPDALAEASEYLTVTLSSPTGASLDALASAATVNILDPGARCSTFSPSFFNNSVRAIALMSNGQILIGGNINHSSGEFASVFNLARLNPDGSVDPTLVTGTGFNADVRAIAVQDDGKILVGGDFNNYNGTACNGLIRLNSDGSIDTNIGGVDNGTVRTIALQSDGKILVGGSFNSFDGYATEGMIRLTAAGARDTGSPLSLPFVTSWNTDIYSLLVQPDGYVMAAGSFWIGGGSTRSGIARLDSDGTRDTSFDPGVGAHTDGAPSTLRSVYDVEQLPDGKYVIGGFLNAYDGNPVPYLARINNDGSFDATFTPPALNTSVRALIAQPSGNVVAGGSFDFGGSRLIRLTSTGSEDTTFGIGSGPSGTLYALAQSESGPLYVGGNFFTFDGSASRPVVKIMGGTAPYDYWALDNFTSAQITSGDADPDADPDADGLNNAAERSLGSDPNIWNPDPVFGPDGSATVSLHVAGNNQYLQVSIDKDPSNLGAWFVAQFTSDLLQPWVPVPALPGSNATYDILEDSETRFVIRDKTPLGTNRRFVKIGIRDPD